MVFVCSILGLQDNNNTCLEAWKFQVSRPNFLVKPKCGHPIIWEGDLPICMGMNVTRAGLIKNYWPILDRIDPWRPRIEIQVQSQQNKMRQFQLISNPPDVRWWALLLILANLANLTSSLRDNSGVTNPWGENQRPKLYTDYLTQHTGKNLISFFFNLSNVICPYENYQSTSSGRFAPWG